MEKSNKKKSIHCFKIIWHYLKDEKLKLFIYIMLVVCTLMPSILSAYFWGKASEALILQNIGEFTKYLVIYSGLYILFCTIFQIPREILYNKLEIKFIKNVSKDLYKKMDELPAGAFEEMGVGEFVNRLNDDPSCVIQLLSKLIHMVCRALVIVFVFVIAINISWILGLEILIFGIVMWFISSKFFPKIKKEQESIKKESDKYIKSATENITGIREIKSLGIRKNIEKNISDNLDTLYKHTAKINEQENVYYGLNNMTYFILQFIILFTCGYLFFKGKISYSMFIMLESCIWRIDEVVESISEFGVSYNKVTVSLQRIDEILNNRLFPSEKFGKKVLDEVEGIIEFNDVNFKYKEDEENTLNGLNLRIEPNKKTAIVGRSGNGKSTIFNLLLRYFDATSGKITIDGINIKDLSEESLRNSISIIRQSPHIFNVTIFDNFKLVKPNITLEEIREVCKRAYIDEYIMSLPEKYDTLIGEGGVNLSGGQKQRLAIARTLLLNTKVILFDEATSALDNESQEYIKKTIDELVNDHTIIIVAHRLSTIVDADVINVIDKGHLVAKGTHNELLKTSDIYKTLYNKEEN